MRPPILALAAVAMLPSCATTTDWPCPSRPPGVGTRTLPHNGDAARPDPALYRPRMYAAMECLIDPCEDFYGYACGGWLGNLERGTEDARWGLGATQAARRNRLALHDIAEVAASSKEVSADRAQLGTFYEACMDIAAIEKSGLDPIAPLLEAIDRADSLETVMAAIAQLHRHGIDAAFSLGVRPHPDAREQGILGLDWPSLGLSSAAAFSDTGPPAMRLRREYTALVARVLGRVDVPHARRTAESAVAFEVALAHLQFGTREFAFATAGTMEEITPAVPWASYWSTLGIAAKQTVLVADGRQLTELGKLLVDYDLEAVRAYLRWQLLRAMGPHMDLDIGGALAEFETLQHWGRKYRPERWSTCAQLTGDYLPDAIAHYYAGLYYSPEDDAYAEEMAADVRSAFTTVLHDARWLDASTRKWVDDRMSSLSMRMGVPDTLLDYSVVPIQARAHAANVLALRAAQFERELYLVGRPLDPDDWVEPAVTANAFYVGGRHEVMVGAGFLQPPMCDRALPRVLNYGAIGSVFGHEFGHAFDADHTAARKTWPEPARHAFEAGLQCMVSAYGRHSSDAGVPVDGRATLSENMADITGLRAAHRAFRTWGDTASVEAPALPGLTDEQAFFVAFAQSMCDDRSPSYERRVGAFDPHPPARVRVNATLAQVPEFADAYACDAGAGMRAVACEVW